MGSDDSSSEWIQSGDLSKDNLDKLHELQRLWQIEAVKWGCRCVVDRVPCRSQTQQCVGTRVDPGPSSRPFALRSPSARGRCDRRRAEVGYTSHSLPCLNGRVDHSFDHSSDDNADDSCAPRYAHDDALLPVKRLFASFASSWQCEGCRSPHVVGRDTSTLSRRCHSPAR